MSNKNNPCLLAIESSCDDTSASVIMDAKILSNVVSSQIIHQKYGGVVPELASRQHDQYIVPVVDQALQNAHVDLADLDAVAFTQGPGLLGSLLVGTSFAKSLAMSLDIPLIAVHHMKAHILAHFIDQPRPDFPFLCLTVSGGHTQIVLVKDFLSMKILGTTIDDAAGEAFDKIGKYLGLDYPAGSIIDRLAADGEHRFQFTKPQVGGLDFSFSGLKTAVLYFLRDEIKKNKNFIEENLVDICHSVQATIVEILIEKLRLAAIKYDINQIAIAGGVSANSALRKKLYDTAQHLSWQLYIPDLQYCTDNAAMIAMSAHFQYIAGDFCQWDITPLAKMPLD